MAHGFNWQVVEDSIGLVCCSWVSWWGGQLERRERLCFWGLHASFVLSSAPLHLFSWHSWFCEALSASGFLLPGLGFLYTHILRRINSFFLVLLDAFSSPSSKQTFSFSIHFLFYIHLFHVSSSYCFFCLARCGFRLLANFR